MQTLVGEDVSSNLLRQLSRIGSVRALKDMRSPAHVRNLFQFADMSLWHGSED